MPSNKIDFPSAAISCRSPSLHYGHTASYKIHQILIEINYCLARWPLLSSSTWYQMGNCHLLTGHEMATISQFYYIVFQSFSHQFLLKIASPGNFLREEFRMWNKNLLFPVCTWNERNKKSLSFAIQENAYFSIRGSFIIYGEVFWGNLKRFISICWLNQWKANVKSV